MDIGRGMPFFHNTRWFSLLRVDVLQFGTLFFKSEKMNFKRSSSIKFSFFSSAVALAVLILTTNQLEKKITGRQALLPPKFYKNKPLYIWALPLIKLLRHWQQCITSFSTIPFKRTLLAISKVSSRHPGVR